MNKDIFYAHHLKKDNDEIVIEFGKANQLFYMKFHSKEEQRVKDRITDVYLRFRSKGYEDINK